MFSLEDVLLVLKAVLTRLGIYRTQQEEASRGPLEELRPTTIMYAGLTELFGSDMVLIPTGYHVVMIYRDGNKLRRALFCNYVPDPDIVPIARVDVAWRYESPPVLATAPHMFNPQPLVELSEEFVTVTNLIVNFLKIVQVAYYYSITNFCKKVSTYSRFSMNMSLTLAPQIVPHLDKRLREATRPQKPKVLCTKCQLIKRAPTIPFKVSSLTRYVKDRLLKYVEESSRETDRRPNCLLIVDEVDCKAWHIDWRSELSISNIRTELSNLLSRLTASALFFTVLDQVNPPTAILIYHTAVTY